MIWKLKTEKHISDNQCYFLLASLLESSDKVANTASVYGANYQLLNTIAKYDNFIPKGKAVLRSYEKSNFCSKNAVTKSFEELIINAQFKYSFLSYNNEGLMSETEIHSIMSKYGKYNFITTDYKRFKADKEENRNHKAKFTTEYSHILEKQ